MLVLCIFEQACSTYLQASVENHYTTTLDSVRIIAFRITLNPKLFYSLLKSI